MGCVLVAPRWFHANRSDAALQRHIRERVDKILSDNAVRRLLEYPESEAVRALRARLWLDADGVWVMGELVEADILIMARGSFSHYAALISDGIKICDPCGWTVPDDWIVRAPDGSIDRAKFELQFNDLVRAKINAGTQRHI